MRKLYLSKYKRKNKNGLFLSKRFTLKARRHRKIMKSIRWLAQLEQRTKGGMWHWLGHDRQALMVSFVIPVAI